MKVINKKNELDVKPFDIGVKDAVHVAIVSVRAGQVIQPGQRCGINTYDEAVPDANGVGVANPFLKSPVLTGQVFWLLMSQKEIPNVKHVWEHPNISFSPPTREPQLNKYLVDYAQGFGITYEQLMTACQHVIDTDTAATYHRTLTSEAMTGVYENCAYDLWSEWANESGHEFYNNGTECCPEYEYPRFLFQ